MLNSVFTILNESVRGPKQWLKLIWDMNYTIVADTIVRHTRILPYLSQIKVNCVYLKTQIFQSNLLDEGIRLHLTYITMIIKYLLVVL